jgi:hypothetical protein
VVFVNVMLVVNYETGTAINLREIRYRLLRSGMT